MEQKPYKGCTNYESKEVGYCDRCGFNAPHKKLPDGSWECLGCGNNIGALCYCTTENPQGF